MPSSSRSFRRGFRGVAVVVATLLLNQTASAHEKWFDEGPGQPTCWCSLASWRPIVAMGIVAMLTILGWIAWRWRGGRDVVPGPERFGATRMSRTTFYGLVPAFLGVHVAVPLLVMGVCGNFLSPNNHLAGRWRLLIGFGEIACALAFFYGAFARAASVALVSMWLAGFLLFGGEPMIENLQYVGFAAFFFCNGRGPFSVDRLLFPRLEPSESLLPLGMPCLRIGVGLSLGFVAFTEKLANPALASSFLQQHLLNFTPYLHIPMCDATFALVCGAVELLVGVWLALGLFPRTIILIAFLPFNLTLIVFQWLELVGHLPFYGAIAALLVWTPGDLDRALWVRGNELPRGRQRSNSTVIEGSH